MKERVKNIKSNMSKGGLWAIYVLPNGKIETITESPENKGEVFNQKLDLFLATKALVGGEIIASGTEE